MLMQAARTGTLCVCKSAMAIVAVPFSSEQTGRTRHDGTFCTGVANLMLDLLAQLQVGGVDRQEGGGPSSLLLLGPPGVGQPLPLCHSCVSAHYGKLWVSRDTEGAKL